MLTQLTAAIRQIIDSNYLYQRESLLQYLLRVQSPAYRQEPLITRYTLTGRIMQESPREILSHIDTALQQHRQEVEQEIVRQAADTGYEPPALTRATFADAAAIIRNTPSARPTTILMSPEAYRDLVIDLGTTYYGLDVLISRHIEGNHAYMLTNPRLAISGDPINVDMRPNVYTDDYELRFSTYARLYEHLPRNTTTPDLVETKVKYAGKHYKPEQENQGKTNCFYCLEALHTIHSAQICLECDYV